MSYDREKRAKRRKRNVYAQAVKTNPIYQEKIVKMKKPKRVKLRPEDIPYEDVDDWSLQVHDHLHSGDKPKVQGVVRQPQAHDRDQEGHEEGHESGSATS